LKTKGRDERLDTLDALEFADRSGERETGGKAEGLTDSERADKCIFLFDIGTDSAKGLWIGDCTIDVDASFYARFESVCAMSQDVEECCLAGTT